MTNEPEIEKKKAHFLWRWLKWIVGVPLILLLVLSIVLAIPSVQTRLAKYGVKFLESSYGLTVELESATIQFPNRIVLKGVYAEDHRADTLIFADEIQFEFLNFSNNHLYAGDVQLDNGKLLMRKYDGDSLYNFAIWLKHFEKEDSIPRSDNPFKFSIADVHIVNFTYAKNPENCPTCTQLNFYDANVHVSDFELDGSYVSGYFHQMDFRDDRRFNLYEFTGLAEVQANYMALSDMHFRTDASEVRGNARLNFQEMSQFSDFINQVEMEGQFEESRISSAEFQSYIPQFPNFDDFDIYGRFYGTVNDLYASHIEVALGSTAFFGDVHITGCTIPSDLYLDANIGYCTTNGYDLEKYVGQFVTFEVPKEVEGFEELTVSGHYEGTIKSFVSRGDIASNLGNAEVNLKFTDLDDIDKVTYEGSLNLSEFQLGEFLSNPDFGQLDVSGEINGHGLRPKSVMASLDVDGSRLDYRGYSYQNISVDGRVAEGMFVGHFDIHDPNVNIDFDGDLDISADTAAFDFVAHIDSTNLHDIGFINDTVSWLEGRIEADFAVYRGDWWEGRLDVKDVSYQRGEVTTQFNDLHLVSRNKGTLITNELHSDIFDARIRGRYRLVDIATPFKAAFSDLTTFYQLELDSSYRSEYSFEVLIKEPDILTQVFIPELQIAPNTTIEGRVSSRQLVVETHIMCPGLLYGKTLADTIRIDVSGMNGVYDLTTDVDEALLSEQIDMVDFALESRLSRDSAHVTLHTTIRDSVPSQVYFEGGFRQLDSTVFSLHFNEGFFNIAHDTLRLDPANHARIEAERMEFYDFNFISPNANFYASGIASPDRNEILRVQAENVNMSLVNYILNEPNTDLLGKIDANVIFNDLFGRTSIAGYVQVDSLGLNNVYLGVLDMDVDWDVSNNIQYLKGDITLGTRQTLHLDGRIAKDSLNPLKIDVTLSRFRINPFNTYLQGILNNVRGTVEGEIHVAGTFAKPTLDGELKLPSVGFGIPFLGTDYNFEGSPVVHLTSDRIWLDRVKIRDTQEATAGYASGYIYHNNLSDLNFDLKIEAENLLSMDLEEGENDYFYGKAYASGRVGIVGPTDNLKLKIEVEAEEGTELKLPLSAPTEVGQSDFITFIEPEEENESAFSFEKLARVENLGGLSIEVNADMRPEAEVRLILDETVGGEIVGKGQGLMRIALNPAGVLSIKGNYAVDEGLYKFKFRNVFTKDFKIQDGSTLSWTGDPFNAQIDLTAVHSTRSTLTGMVSEANGYTGQRVKVNLIMHLTGPLTNPNIEFDIKVPNVQSSWQEELSNRLNDQDELTQNAFSLLLTNSFWSSESNIVEDVGQESVNQLANVMSNWATNSVFGDVADVNLSYQTFDDPEYSGSEVEVGVSKGFYDERITVNTNVDIPLEGTTTSSGGKASVTGDIEVEYKITEDGRFRTKAFNRSNQNNPALDELSPYSQGVSVFYREDFSHWGELIEKIFGYRPEEVEVEFEEISGDAEPTDAEE